MLNKNDGSFGLYSYHSDREGRKRKAEESEKNEREMEDIRITS